MELLQNVLLLADDGDEFVAMALAVGVPAVLFVVSIVFYR